MGLATVFLTLLPALLHLGTTSLAAPGDGVGTPPAVRAKALREFLRQERSQFEARESQRRDTIGELDKLNANQNQIRQRLEEIRGMEQEMTMALENLSVETDRQKDLELVQRRRLVLLLKVVYRVQRDGLLRFVLNGDGVADMAGRVRVLLRTLRSHTELSKQIDERSERLKESERKVSQVREESQRLLVELREQEALLGGLLTRKRGLLGALDRKQGRYQAVQKEYQEVSRRVAKLFENFEAMRGEGQAEVGGMPARGSLPLPIAGGTIVKHFGRAVHSKFRTVTFQKGIEIEAEQSTPVAAVMSGIVEYEGWVKGLGNVLILHHGGGFYTLSAHLFKTLQSRGTRVQQGETIGLVGDTGSSERSSLYFEVRENNKAVDPIVYFSPGALKALN